MPKQRMKRLWPRAHYETTEMIQQFYRQRKGERLQHSASSTQHTTQQQQNAVKMVPNQANTSRGAQNQQQTAVEMEEKSGQSK